MKFSFKKIICCLLVFAMFLPFAACERTAQNDKFAESTENSRTPETDASTKPDGKGKALVVYFSWSGNTETMASTIAERVGADLLQLQPAVAYPEDYSECAETAKRERDENARPAIANLPTDLSAYDTVFVGYPIWWHTAPMIIGTFLESFDLTGKQIYPFTQSASMDTEHFENSMAFVTECAKGATVHEGLFSRASDIDRIEAYLTENGFMK